ncbi:MAG: nucleoside kinase, partial [Bacteroidales bacterium]
MEITPKKTNTVEIICKNTNITKEYPLGTSLYEICADQNVRLSERIIAAKVNNKLRELDYEVFKPKIIEFITIEDSTGHSMYMRSILFILFKAVRDLYPQASLHIEHSLPLGFYCEIQALGEDLNIEHIEAIQNRAHEIIALDLPFERKQILTPDAIEVYKKNRLFEKVALFETRNELYTSVYTLDNVANYFYGYLVPSTGYIKEFYITKYFNGLLALLPKKFKELKQNTNSKSFIKESENGGSKLFKIFQEHKDWLDILGVPYVGTLNKVIEYKAIGQIIKIAEALHEKKIAKIADEINLQKDCKLVLISGPSSSGKTTFCKRLGVQLQVLGYKTVEISLDNYFLDREFTPKDIHGDYDFESIDTIDIPFFNQQLLALLNNEEIESPEFDFISGKKKNSGKMLKMDPKSILIIEGIHALTPKLTLDIQNKFKYKIFVSALTHI